MFHALLVTALLLKAVRTSEGQLQEAVSQPKLSSKDTFAMIGQNVTLLCSASQGSLPIEFMFFRGTHCVSTTKVHNGNKSAEFTFSVNISSDAGEYKCTAGNNFTTDKKYSNGLNVTLVDLVSQPRLSSDTAFTAIGQSVALFCFCRAGTPPIIYRLFRSGVQRRKECVEKADKTVQFSLTINNVSDIGEYKCTAENNVTGPKRYSNGLNFTLVEPVSKPKLYTDAISITMGQEVNLSCQSEDGTPPINYSFFIGDTLLSFITKRDSLPAVLTLNLNSTTDFGTYQCKAENMLVNTEKHSDGFNFTLGVAATDSSGLIIGILALYLVVLFVILAISLWNLPKCKARKRSSFQAADVPTGNETGSPVCNEFTKDPVPEHEESTAEYSEILIRESN